MKEANRTGMDKTLASIKSEMYLSSSSETSFVERMSQIPAHLKIRVLHDDAVFVVIDKPRNLRSVPGHANPPPHLTNRKRPRSLNRDGPERRTGQEAWAAAIRTFRDETEEDTIGACLQRLSAADNLIASIPRKFKLFQKYVERNQKRLFMSEEAGKGIDVPATAKALFERIQDRQRPLMNLPEPTRHEDSAFGQLILLGYDKNDISDAGKNSDLSLKRLFVVHRLDCETSGVMVFAKSEQAASFLSQAWRERESVSKIYLAKVTHWPPYLLEEKQRHGTIAVPLTPSDERLKWKVCKEGEGKSSTTLWRVLTVLTGDALVLELRPVTGRTHQLRVHCAHVGSGIVGDSLYGNDRVEQIDPSKDGTKLHLHAHQLSFPHPATKKECTYISSPDWL